MRVVVDTNILVSALLFGGVPGHFPGLWKKRSVTPLISTEIMKEYLRVLAYPKFKLTEEEIEHFTVVEILPWFEIVTVENGRRYVQEDPDDDKFIWCALAGKASVIVSGDEHLLSCSNSPIPIFSAADVLKNFF